MKRTILYFGVVISILLLSGCSTSRWQSPYIFEEDVSKQNTTKKEVPKKRYVHPCLTHTGGCVW